MTTLSFDNESRAFYEGAKANAIGLNGWTQDYIRAEREQATPILDRRHLERFSYDPGKQWADGRQGEGEEIPLLQQPKWANTWLIEKFVRWLDGGKPKETNVEDNLPSVALVFAAVESRRTGQLVRVQEFLPLARQEGEAD